MTGERLFISEDRKTIAMLILKGTENISCDGSQMKKLIANTTDAAQEKHIPEFSSSRKCRASYDFRTLDSVDLSANKKRRSISSP